MKRTFFLLIMLLTIGLMLAQTPFTATYTFGADGNVTSFTYNGTTYSGMTMGTLDKVGVTTASSSGNFRATNWPLASTPDIGKYFGFVMTATSGYKFTVNTITFGIGRSGTGTRDSQWRGSADSYSALINNYTTLASGITNNAGVLNNPDDTTGRTGNVLALGSSYTDITASCGFRYYMYSAEAAGGTAGLQGPITITGSFQTTGGTPVVATPTFNPTAGTYGSTQSVTISTTTADATIHYTTNGDDPTQASTTYTSTISVSQNTTIKAKAWKTGMDPSAVATAAYIIKAATPTFDPVAGTYSGTQTVTMACATSGASIYYTTNGDTPTTASTPYSEPISVSTTTTVKAIASATNYGNSDVATALYTIETPATTSIPYTEAFTSGFGACYTYNVSGTKVWTIAGGAAEMNAYNGSFPEEHWLVLPGINFANYSAERMTFTNSVQYGTIDTNNYLKLYYSTDYLGVGSPVGASWTEIPFTHPTPTSTLQSISSGVLDLSGISGSAYLAFKYYSGGTPSLWRVDTIDVYIATPSLSVTPATLSGFTYVHQAGPSTEKTFSLSAGDLQGDVTVTAPADYEISKTSVSGFTNSLTYTTSELASAQTVYVRLEAGLTVGTYNGQVITASTSSATDKTVTCSGEVTTPPAPAAPFASAAGSINSSGFTVNWGSVSGADGYYLDVYTKTAGSNPSDLFISEYVEGTSDNKAIEVYNGTGAAVDLANYTIKKQVNGAGSFVNDLVLSGTLANNDVYVIASNGGSTNLSGNSYVDLPTNSAAINFNGNDAVALYSGTTQIDVVGIVNQVSPNWGAEVTLVRKSTISEPTTTFSMDDWDSYAQDTFTYLGSHTFSGGSVMTYIGTYQNKDVGNVTSYAVTGLNPETTYYYVVRAYDAYSQTSPNSNEITVPTPAAPAAIVVNADGTATGAGATIVDGGTVPSSLLGADSGVPAVIYTITAIGTHDVTVYKTAAFQGDWYCWLNTPGGLIAGANPIQGADFYTFTGVNFDAKGDVVVILNDNQTLPVELSSFTATISAQNFVNLMWTTQSETGVSGFYIYRGTVEDASQAELISPMIDATNTSVTHTYLFTDNQLYNDGVYYYWLQNVDFDGTNSFHGPVVVNYSTGTGGPGTPVIPEVTELKGIFPNPFNPTAQISYSLKDAASVSIKVYNSRGQIVRSFDNAPGTVGNHRIVWDGRDFRGSSCSTGVYFVRMFAGKEVFTQKAVLVK